MGISNIFRVKQLDVVRCVIIVLLLFANLIYCNTIYGKNYSIIVVCVSIITMFYSFLHLGKMKSIWKDKYIRKYLLWIVALFLFFWLHSILGPYNKDMPLYSMLSQGLIVIIVILWLGDLPIERAFYLFIVSSTIASVLVSIYVLTYYLGNNIMAINARLGADSDFLEIRNINFISQSVFLFSTLTMYQVFFGEKNNKIFAFLFIIQLILVLLSGTRRAIIGLPLFYIAFTYIKQQKLFYKYFLPLILGVGLFLYLLINNEFLYNIAGNRLEGILYVLGITNGIGDDSTVLRKTLFDESFKMIPLTPFWGNGFAYFETHSIGLNTGIISYHSHNNFMELYLNYGIFGFILYYSVFIGTMFRLIRRRNKTRITFLFITFFFFLFFIIEPSSVTYFELPTYYLYLFFAYIYSRKQNSFLPNKTLLI